VRQIEVSAFEKVQNAVKHRVAAMGSPAVCTECMARPRSASGFLRLSLDQSAVMYPAPEHSLWP
jgi:DUF917 family protein